MASTPYPFVSSTVLTASQLNSTFNIPVTTKTASHTLIAGDAGTRVVMNSASATTITVNTSIFSAGDNLQISNVGAGVTTVTAGTATVSSAGPLAIPQYGGGTLYFTSAGVAIFFPSAGPAASSGLTFISAGTVSAGATISVLNAFSTTYDFYSMRFSNFELAQDNRETRIQFGTAGVADTGANYNSRGYYADTSISASGGVNVTSMKVNENSGTTKNSLFLEISSPFLSATTYVSSQGYGNFSSGMVGHAYDGFVDTSTSYTDIFFKSNIGNMGPFTYALFGYAKS
jgi:hypothetical protein